MINVKVSLLTTFGPQVRGISPYSDGLLNALTEHSECSVQPIDFIRMYPTFLHPGKEESGICNQWQIIHYAKPHTWNYIFRDAPDLIHIQYWNFVQLPIYLSILKRAAKLKIPCVITAHNTKGHESINLTHKFEKQLYTIATAIITHTNRGVDDLVDSFKISREKIHVIPHGIELPKSNLTDKQVETNRVLFFGNIRDYKGVDVLLDAWPLVAQKVKDAELVIAGRLWDGSGSLFRTISSALLGQRSYAKSVRSKIDALNQMNIDARLRYISEDEAHNLMNSSKIGVFPYKHFNAQSGATLKAAAQGLPIIVTNTGGLPDICIDNSFVCNPGSAEELAMVITEKLNGWNNRWPSEQKSKLNSITWERVADTTTALYTSLASKLNSEH